MQPTTADLKAILSAVATLNSSLEIEDLQDRTISAVNTVLSSEMIAFDVFQNEHEYLQTQWNNNPAFFTAERLEGFAAVFNEDPFENPIVEPILVGNHAGSLKISDFVSGQSFRQTAIYSEFFKAADSDEMLGTAITVSPSVKMSCGVMRGTQFNERDRTVLDLLRPHLENAIRNSIAYTEQLRSVVQVSRLLGATSRGLLRCNFAGQVATITDAARSMFSEFFERTVNVGDSIPSRLAEEIRLVEIENDVVRHLRFVSAAARLRISIIPCVEAREITMLLESSERLGPSALESLGLTSREAEVLYWVMQGKTDHVISLLLGISVRTVEKHVQNILAKLHAENRATAVAVAIESLQAIQNSCL